MRKHLNKTEAEKVALENELRRVEVAQPLRERLRPLQDRVGLASHVVRPAGEISAAIGYRVIPNEADKSTIGKISVHPARLNGGLR